MKGAIVVFLVFFASYSFADPTKDLFDALEKSDHQAFKNAMQRHPNVRAKNADGESVLHVCARVGDARPMPDLVDAGARVEATNHLGQTALHVAAAYGHGEEIRALVALNARIRVQDRAGMTPMDLAVQHEENEALEYLLAEAERQDRQIPIHPTALNRGLLSGATVPVALAAGFFLTMMFSSKSGQ